MSENNGHRKGIESSTKHALQSVMAGNWEGYSQQVIKTENCVWETGKFLPDLRGKFCYLFQRRSFVRCYC